MTKKHEEYKDKKKKKTNYPAIIVISLAIIAVVIIGATTVFSPKEKVDYGTYRGFVFEQSGKFWLTRIQLNDDIYEAPFYNHPLDLLDIYYDDSITTMFLDEGHQLIYIAVDGDGNSVPVLAGINIGRVTGKLYGLPTSSALYVLAEDRVEESEFPQVSCEDATQETPIIRIDAKAENLEVTRDNDYPYCVIVSGTNDENILEAADLLTYKLLEIIPASTV